MGKKARKKDMGTRAGAALSTVADESKGPQSRQKKVRQSFSDPLSIAEDILFALLFFSVAIAYSSNLLVSFTLPKLVALRACTLFLVVAWAFRVKRGAINPIPPWILYPGLALGGWWIVSTFFAFHLPTAIHGVNGRYNGLLTHLNWLLLFFIAASIPMAQNRVERILKLFIGALLPVSLYAILQYSGLDFVNWVTLQGRSASFTGHPVMLCALLGLALPFCIAFLFSAKGVWSRVAWTTVAVLFFVAALTTMSRGPLIGIVISLAIVFWACLKFGKRMKIPWLYVSIAAAVLGAAVLVTLYLSGGRIVERFQSGQEIQVRITYYKAALRMVKARPVVGIGFENFRVLYPGYRLREENRFAQDVVPTMVHNGYIQTALTNGIPALLLYLLLLVMIMWYLGKGALTARDPSRRLLLWAFCASLSGFLIQDLSGWLEISLTTYFWIILGLAVSIVAKGTGSLAGTRIRLFALLPFGLLCAAGFIYLTGDAVNRVYTDHLFRVVENRGSNIPPKEAERLVAEALDSVRGDFYYEDLGGSFYSKRFGETGGEEFLKKAFDLYESAHKTNPFDVYVLIHRIELETFAIRKGVMLRPSPFAEYGIRRVLEMDGNNPTVYQTLTKLRLAEQRQDDALKFMALARDSSGGSWRHHLFEGEVYNDSRQFQSALLSYAAAIEFSGKIKPLPPEWLHAKYGHAMALAGTGQVAKAAEEVREVLVLFPGSLVGYLIMGNLSNALGDTEKARDAFGTALRIEPSNGFAAKGYREAVEKLRGRPSR